MANLKPSQWLYVENILTQRPLYEVSGYYSVKIKTDCPDLVATASATLEILRNGNVSREKGMCKRLIIERSDVPGVSVLVCSTSGGE